MPKPILRADIARRASAFMQSVEVSGPDDCWNWKRPCKARYPSFSVNDVTIHTHTLQVAQALGVWPSHAWQIRKRKTWAHL